MHELVLNNENTMFNSMIEHCKKANNLKDIHETI